MLTEDYRSLNSEVNLLDENGELQLNKDEDATRSYFLNFVNKNTVFFHNLHEKTDYLVKNELWSRDTVEMYSFDQFKALFKQAYAHKFRFQSFIGALKFYTQYALKTEDNKRFYERYEDRVVMCAIDLSNGDYQLAKDIIEAIMGGYFQPATPTFLNAGRAKGGERISCFLIRTDDNMESIGRTFMNSLQLSKRGGGVGINLTNLREIGAPILNILGTASGVIPVMKVLEDIFSYANQLGQRQGAGAVYLNAHHPDIMRFLDTKRENADEKIRIKTLSLGVIVPDITFELAKKNEHMYLFSPYDVERVEGKAFSDLSVTENYYKWVEDERIRKTQINARSFFMTLSEIQFESGYPYVLFEDTANNNHTMKHAGRVQMSNLCSEILQLQTPSTYTEDASFKTIGSDISCNLGSLNVKRMLDLDNAKFDHIVETATRALDNVTRLTNLNSAPSIKAGNERSRSIGLGQMNLHGALAHNDLEYGSDEALELWDKYMSKVTRAAMHASALIARDRGGHSYFDGSEYDTGEWFDKKVTPWFDKYEDLSFGDNFNLSAPSREDWHKTQLNINKFGMANAYLQAIPPTGSISYINHSTSSIHPVAAPIEVRKEGMLGRVYYPAPHMTKDNVHLFKDAYNIGYEKIIDTYAVSQHWIDQGQSCTLFFKADSTTRDLDRARIYAWRKGIKALYYIRLRSNALEGTEVESAAGYCESCQL